MPKSLWTKLFLERTAVVTGFCWHQCQSQLCHVPSEVGSSCLRGAAFATPRLKLREELERTCFGTCSSSALRWVRGTVFCPPPRFHLWMSRGHCMNLMLNAQLSNPVADLIPCRLGSSLLKVCTLGIPQPWSSPETGHRPAMSVPGNLQQICRRPDLPLPKNET